MLPFLPGNVLRGRRHAFVFQPGGVLCFYFVEEEAGSWTGH